MMTNFRKFCSLLSNAAAPFGLTFAVVKWGIRNQERENAKLTFEIDSLRFVLFVDRIDVLLDDRAVVHLQDR